MQVTIEIEDGDLDTLAVELGTIVAAEAAALDWIEPVAARIGLSRDATDYTLAVQRARLRTLVRAQRLIAACVAACVTREPTANEQSATSSRQG